MIIIFNKVVVYGSNILDRQANVLNKNKFSPEIKLGRTNKSMVRICRIEVLIKMFCLNVFKVIIIKGGAINI